MQILADMNCVRVIEIIRILVRSGEKLPLKELNKLYKRMDILDAQISEREKEYREIAQALSGI